jgi:hypothetical protein
MAIDISRIAKDAYTWCAKYHDGTQIPEYDESCPNGRGFAEVSASQVATLELSSAHKVAVPHGATPVFFRRRRMELNPNDDNVVSSTTTHCIGWKKGENACYLFVSEDGSTLLTNDAQAV